MEDKKVPSKYALVTGGSRGIGRAVCIQLAKDSNYHVIINYNSNEAAAKETLKEVEAAGGCGEIIQCNVVDAAEVVSKLDK